MLISEFLSNKTPSFLLGAFFSRYVLSPDRKYFYTYSSYKKSKLLDDKVSCEESKEPYLRGLNNASFPLGFWIRRNDFPYSTKSDFVYVLENDLGLDRSSFYNKLYAKILTNEFVFISDLNEDKKSFLRGFMELRGSIDTNRPLIAQDYFYNSAFEIKRARLFTDYFEIPLSLINLNFRELQNQYVTGKNKRNTQFRLNLLWYLKNIGLINEYKVEIVKAAYPYKVLKVENGVTYFETFWETLSKNDTFDWRLQYFANKIFDIKLTKHDIAVLRKEMQFDMEHNLDSVKRDVYIVNLVRYNTPDDCACCVGEFDICDRTYVNKNTGRLYFEIHHVISLGKNKHLDDEDNLVKLCPACHRLLKKGSATKLAQIGAIKKIIKNKPKTLEFAKKFYDSDDVDYILEKVFQDLK